MKKNGFTKFQNQLINEVKTAKKEGATLEACSIIIGTNNDVSEQYVIDIYNSYLKLMKVIA